MVVVGQRPVAATVRALRGRHAGEAAVSGFAVQVCDACLGERLDEGGVHGVSFQQQADAVCLDCGVLVAWDDVPVTRRCGRRGAGG
jgi:hypothetical protein